MERTVGGHRCDPRNERLGIKRFTRRVRRELRGFSSRSRRCTCCCSSHRDQGTGVLLGGQLTSNHLECHQVPLVPFPNNCSLSISTGYFYVKNYSLALRERFFSSIFNTLHGWEIS